MIKKRIAGIPVLILAFGIGLSSCKKPEATVEEVIESEYDHLIDVDLMGLTTLPPAIDPADNPSTQAKVDLGRMLFWDPIIGGEKDMACVTCHHPDFGYTDGLDLPIGVNGTGLGPDRIANSGGLDLTNGDIERVPRNAPTVINAAYNGFVSEATFDASNSPHFWDGRSSSFEEQSSGPPGSRSEMRGDAYEQDFTFDTIVNRLAAIDEYVTMFGDAFGGGAETITEENFNKAVGAWERSIIAINSPYDQYIQGDLTAITEQQKLGLLLFNGRANCADCHKGAAFNDGDFHKLGIPENPDSPHSLLAEGDTGKDELYLFKTPTLRNIALTGPYTHNGIFTTLEEMVDFKNNGVSVNDNIAESELEPLGLSDEEKAALVAFLHSLTDNNFDKTIPTSVPSGLPVGGSIN